MVLDLPNHLNFFPFERLLEVVNKKGFGHLRNRPAEKLNNLPVAVSNQYVLVLGVKSLTHEKGKALVLGALREKPGFVLGHI